MNKVAAGIALTSTIVKPVAACNVVTVGRVQLGIDGLSQKCCDGVKPKLDNVVATKGKGKGKEEAMMAFVENCCDEGDQHVLDTLALTPAVTSAMNDNLQMVCSKGKGKGKAEFVGGPSRSEGACVMKYVQDHDLMKDIQEHNMADLCAKTNNSALLCDQCAESPASNAECKESMHCDATAAQIVMPTWLATVAPDGQEGSIFALLGIEPAMRQSGLLEESASITMQSAAEPAPATNSSASPMALIGFFVPAAVVSLFVAMKRRTQPSTESVYHMAA